MEAFKLDSSLGRRIQMIFFFFNSLGTLEVEFLQSFNIKKLVENENGVSSIYSGFRG